MRVLFRMIVVGAVAAALLPAPFAAQTVSKTAAFALDQWYEIEKTSGPVTVHRLILRTMPGNLKSKVFRPGNAEHLGTVQIEIEFSNDATRDIDARVHVRWLDEDGRVIDGYNDDEEFDEGERHGRTTITLSTLKYGIERAKKIAIDLNW